MRSLRDAIISVKKQMRIVMVSDTHMGHWDTDIPDGDIFIHAGDATYMGTAAEFDDFNRWVGTLSFRHKIFVPGNHDFLFEESFREGCKVVSNATCLIDNDVTVDGLKIWGSPYTLAFMEWAFMENNEAGMQKHFENIPHDTDVLVTHSPPYHFGGLNGEGVNCGSRALSGAVPDKTRLHVFGHIHEGYGMKKKKKCKFVNASVMNGLYQIVNDPVIIDL